MELGAGVIYKLIISIILGGFIGVERQLHQQDEDKKLSKKGPAEQLGLRTFSLITLLGAITGLILPTLPLLAGMVTGFVMVLTLVFYFFDSWYTKDYGITTELAVIFMFLMGVFIGLPIFSLQVVVALTILAAVVLSRKDKFKAMTDRLHKAEVSSFISYLVIALVVLPLIPNQSYSMGSLPYIGDLFGSLAIPKNVLNLPFLNPFSLWLYVALITGVDVAGYILERTVGQKKGWLLTSTVAGFISSTALTFSIAKESKKSSMVHILVGGALIGNITSFIQIAILMGTFNPKFFAQALPTISLMMLVGISVVYFFYHQSRSKNKDLTSAKTAIASTKLFNIYPALKFVGLYLIITIISKVAYAVFGNAGYLISMGLAAMTGMDAVVISLSQFAGGQISFELALLTFVTANMINLLVKTAYAFLEGSRQFAFRFFVGVLAITIAGFVGFVLTV